MTSPERLRAYINGLDDEEAQHALDRLTAVVAEGDSEAEPIIEGATDLSGLRALFEQWRIEPCMTDAEWDDFAAGIDRDRPHRPLFS